MSLTRFRIFTSPRYRHGNVGRFYLWSFLVRTAALALLSTTVLFWLARGLGLGQIMIFMSTYSISLLIFEIPTGVLADRFSRKWSLVIGALLQVAAGVTMVSTNYVPVLIGVYVLIGLGFAFISGAGGALIYDFLKQRGREEDAQHVFGAGTMWFQIGGVTGAVIGGLLVARFELSAAVWAHKTCSSSLRPLWPSSSTNPRWSVSNGKAPATHRSRTSCPAFSRTRDPVSKLSTAIRR